MLLHSGERYRIYIDESGDHVFHDLETLGKQSHRYLALLGCIFADKHYRPFHEKLEDLKQKYFPHNPDEPVILHRKEMINFQGPFWRLREAGYREKFDAELLTLVKDAAFTIILVVIDKLTYKTKYPDPFHPYHICLDFVMQRYAGLLNHINRQGDMMVEARGGTENRLLTNAYEHIYTHGDMHHESEFYKRVLTSKEIKLKPKKSNIAGLQLADILAYPLKQQYLSERGITDEPLETFGHNLAEAAAGKYNRHLYDNHIEGYGRVLFPK